LGGSAVRVLCRPRVLVSRVPDALRRRPGVFGVICELNN